MNDPNVAYIDIGALLDAAREALPSTSNTVIHGEAFSLLEAMSAVEIGNPKMDTGMAALPKTLEQLLAEGAAPVDLSQQQRLAIMDKLLEHEATWHSGGALAQTVFSCLYMLKPDRIAGDPCLLAYCKAVNQTCSLVRSLILHGNVVEEEDFNVHAFGLPVDEQAKSGPPPAPPAATPAVQQAAETAVSLAALDKALALCQTGAGKQATPEQEAMALRLNFRKQLLLGLAAVLNKGSPQLETATQNLAAALQVLEQVSTSAPAAGVMDEVAASVSRAFDESVNRNLMAPSPPRALRPLSWEASCSFLKSSLHHMVQALAVRSVDGYDALQQHILDFARLRAFALARSVAHYVLLHHSWNLPDPAASSSSIPNGATIAAASDGASAPATTATAPNSSDAAAVSQASSKHTAAGPNGTSCADASTSGQGAGTGPPFLVSLAMIAEACYLPPTAHKSICPDVDMFLEQSVIAVSNWCQAMLMNPCRQRRRLRRGLEDWGHLYHHALNAEFAEQFKEHTRSTGWQWQPEETPEGQPIQGPLATWVERGTCSCMLQHLLMGFELELYEPKEYTMIYWYCDALCNCQRAAAQLLRASMPGAPSSSSSSSKQPSLPARGASAKGAKKKKPAPALPQAPQASAAATAAWDGRQRVLQLEELRLERTHHLCQGYMRLMLALKKSGLLKERSPPFNGDTERFDQRFSSFHHFVSTPEPLTYHDFIASTDTSKFTAQSLLALAVDAFDVARKCLAYETHTHLLVVPDELKDLERVATQNIMACHLVSRAMQQSETAALTLAVSCDNFTRHRNFPAIGVKSVKA